MLQLRIRQMPGYALSVHSTKCHMFFAYIRKDHASTAVLESGMPNVKKTYGIYEQMTYQILNFRFLTYPDLNQIEHTSDILKRQFLQRQNQSNGLLLLRNNGQGLPRLSPEI